MKALLAQCNCVGRLAKDGTRRCKQLGALVRITGCTLSVVQYVCAHHKDIIAAEGLTVTELSQVEAECVDTAQGS